MKGPGKTIAWWALAGVVTLATAMLAVHALNPRTQPSRPLAIAAPAPKQAAPVPKPLSAPPPVAPAEEAMIVRRVLQLDRPLRHGDYVWDDAGAPAGPIIITVDLKAETLSVFRAGYEIGVAAIMFGARDKLTPLGTFPITEKDADHVSNLYHAPMPYMLRLTNDGVSIHGSKVEWGGATHGCIGVPIPFARLLFAQASLGDHVIVTDGKMLQPGAHPPA